MAYEMRIRDLSADVCSSDLFDDRYGYPGEYALLKCVSCGHHRLATEMNGDEIGDLYTNYYPRSSFDVEAWSPPREEGRLRVWWSGLKASAFRWVPRDVTILDVGCGFGEALGYHRARGCDAHGIERSEERRVGKEGVSTVSTR